MLEFSRGEEKKVANTHRMILGSARKALPVPDKQIAALQLQFARQLHDRCLERHGENHEQTRLVLDHIAALERRDSLAASRRRIAPPEATINLFHCALLPLRRLP
jgi:hypothetical protein